MGSFDNALVSQSVETPATGGNDIQPFDKQFNTLPAQSATERSSQPTGIAELDEAPLFFILDNKNGSGDSSAPPTALPNPEKPKPLEITDEQGRVIATDAGPANWSINKNATTGEIDSINYPDGKVRNFKHENGQLSRIETVEKGADGQPVRTVLGRDPATGKWYAEVGGLKAEIPGDITFTKDGVLSFQIDGTSGKDATWRTESPNGKVSIERTVQSGARIAFNDDKSVQQITRPDQTRVEAVRTSGELTGFNEIGADGKTTAWVKNGDKFVSNTNPPQERTKVELDENGNFSFVTGDNVKHTVTGGGVELNQNPNGSEFQFDNQGRFTELKDANGLRIRGIQYHPETNQVTRAQIGSPEAGQMRIYEREGTSNSWKVTVTDGSGKVVKQDTWLGDVAVGKDGTYAYKEDAKYGRNNDGLWTVYKMDGSNYLMQDNGQGGKAIFDLNRNLLAVERTNGTRLDVARTNGAATEFTETQRDGSAVKYKFDAASKQFVSDNPGYPPVKNIEAEGSGRTKITDLNGSVYMTGLDGSTVVKNLDGSTAELDNHGQLIKTSSQNGDLVRTFNWENGKLISVHEARKNGESRSLVGKDMTATLNGTIKYTDADGQKLSTTGDGSWQSYQTINGKDLLVKVVNPKGELRSIIRDANGEPMSIVDSKPAAGGQPARSEEIRRVHEGGRWTDSWGVVRPGGRIEARHNLRLLDNGSYSYIDSNGKDRVDSFIAQESPPQPGQPQRVQPGRPDQPQPGDGGRPNPDGGGGQGNCRQRPRFLGRLFNGGGGCGGGGGGRFRLLRRFR